MKRVGEWKALGRYGTVGLELVLSILIGFFGGRWLDAKAGTQGWLTALGFVVGTYAGFRGIYKVYKLMQREAAREDELERSRMAEYLAKDDPPKNEVAEGDVSRKNGPAGHGSPPHDDP